MKTIGAFEIIDHGVDGEQYFPGCGVAFTDFEDCFTGIGETAVSALGDALEHIGTSDWDVASLESRPDFRAQADTLSPVSRIDPCEECAADPNHADRHDNEVHHYVSIRVAPAA